MCEKESFEKLTKTFFNILRSTNYSVSYIHTSVCQSLEESLRIETNCVQSNMKVSNPFLSFQLHDNRSPFLLFRKSMTYVIIQSEGDGGGGGKRGVMRHLPLIIISIFINAAFHGQTTINIELILHKMDFSTVLFSLVPKIHKQWYWIISLCFEQFLSTCGQTLINIALILHVLRIVVFFYHIAKITKVLVLNFCFKQFLSKGIK